MQKDNMLLGLKSVQESLSKHAPYLIHILYSLLTRDIFMNQDSKILRQP